jgi:hypothetical protein
MVMGSRDAQKGAASDVMDGAIATDENFSERFATCLHEGTAGVNKSTEAEIGSAHTRPVVFS